eukprot:scaffold4081_cov268-Pinguiococcus_pyrenoidosus.AAC.8
MQSNLEAVLPAQRGVGNRTEVPHRHHGDGREDGHDAAVDADGVRHGLQLLLERGVRRFHREVRLDAAPARVASDRNDDTECVAVEHLAAGQQERILPFRFGLLLRLASETALVADASRASADDGIRCDLVAGLQLQDVAHDDILDADLLLHAIANDLDLHIFPHGVQFPELQLLAVVIGGRNHRHNQDGYEDRRSLDPALGRVVVEADGKRDHRADDEHDQGGVVEAVDEEIQPGLRLRRRNLVPAIHLRNKAQHRRLSVPCLVPSVSGRRPMLSRTFLRSSRATSSEDNPLAGSTCSLLATPVGPPSSRTPSALLASICGDQALVRLHLLNRSRPSSRSEAGGASSASKTGKPSCFDTPAVAPTLLWRQSGNVCEAAAEAALLAALSSLMVLTWSSLMPARSAMLSSTCGDMTSASGAPGVREGCTALAEGGREGDFRRSKRRQARSKRRYRHKDGALARSKRQSLRSQTLRELWPSGTPRWKASPFRRPAPDALLHSCALPRRPL